MRAAALLLFSLCVVGSVEPDPLVAQETTRRHLTASVGVFSYQLSKTGVAPLLAVRGTMPVSSVLTLEVGLVGSRPEYQVGENSTFVAPEAQLQLSLPFDSFIPYMGLGTGAVLDFGGAGEGGSSLDMTISGSLGMRVWINSALGFQAEFRGRGIGFDFAGSSSEYSAGLAWQL